MINIAERASNIRARIDKACQLAGRASDEVTLIAVSKTQPVEALKQARDAGLIHLGENYVQEAVEKFDQLKDLDLCWHFIGPLQSNKTRLIAERFDWLHTLDRAKIAKRINDQRPENLPPMRVLIQVNISQDPNKSGVSLEEIAELAEYLQTLPHLELRGLMAIPAADLPEETLRQQFQQLKNSQTALHQQYPECDTLSIGMSDDFEIAIDCGATMIRVGSAIFGPRQYSNP